VAHASGSREPRSNYGVFASAHRRPCKTTSKRCLIPRRASTISRRLRVLLEIRLSPILRPFGLGSVVQESISTAFRRDALHSRLRHQLNAEAIAAIDLCVVPTLTFECLFAFLVVSHGRRQLLWFAVTRHPSAEWLAQQFVEAFPWGTAPTYLVRDNDGAYGQAFTNRVRTMEIRDRPMSPRSPWQNAYVERLIGTLRRECLDHVLIYGERHLQTDPDFVFALL
jgi:transposase InsO family protein